MKKLPIGVEFFRDFKSVKGLKQEGIRIIHKFGIGCYKKTCKVVCERE